MTFLAATAHIGTKCVCFAGHHIDNLRNHCIGPTGIPIIALKVYDIFTGTVGIGHNISACIPFINT